MEKVLVVSLLVLASLRSASTEEYFFKEGGSVDLDLRPVPSGPIIIIQWKFKDIILAEWVKDVLPLTHNRENIKLDMVSGRLAMAKMTKADEGVYSVEVNNNVQKETYNVVLIKDVPKPKIWVTPLKCNDEGDQCTLTCEGNTTGAEPITYSWKADNGDWKESQKVMPITKKEHGDVKEFTCKMKNQVSEKESDPLTNRLRIKKEEQEGYSTGWIIGSIICFLILLVAVAVVIWLLKKDKLRCWKRRTSSEVGTAENGMAGFSKADEENKGLLEKNDEKQVSQEGPAGEAEPPKSPHEDKTDSKEEPAGEAEPPKSPHEDKTDSKEGPAGEAEPPKSPHDDKTVSKDEPAEADDEQVAKL